MRGWLLGGSAAFFALAGAVLYLARGVPGAAVPAAELPRMLAWAVALGFAALGVYCLVLALGRAESPLARLGVGAEERRFRRDPRFRPTPPPRA